MQQLTACSRHPYVQVKPTCPVALCETCVQELRHQWQVDQGDQCPALMVNTIAWYHIYIGQGDSCQWVDASPGLSDALEILEIYAPVVEWGAVQHIGQTIVHARDGVISRVEA